MTMKAAARRDKNRELEHADADGSAQAGNRHVGTAWHVSLDPLMENRGYPELFQTGETADGTTHLTDRQHPHDLLMELAAFFSATVIRQFGIWLSGFAWRACVGSCCIHASVFRRR